MVNRRALGATISLTAAALPIFACAAIADVEPIAYRPENHGAASDATPGVDVDVDVGVDVDVPLNDDADALPDANDDAQLCDTDDDGDGVTSEACGGTDCDDSDPHTHPGADFIDSAPPPGKNGDWNCDGVVTKQFPENLDCSSLTATDCATYSGFVTKATCGEAANFVACFVSQGAYLAKVQGLRKQGCK